MEVWERHTEQRIPVQTTQFSISCARSPFFRPTFGAWLGRLNLKTFPDPIFLGFPPTSRMRLAGPQMALAYTEWICRSEIEIPSQ
jgi:hypothetical protein